MTLDAVGGVWQYAVELARALAAHDVRTVLALLGPAPDEAQRAEVEALAGVSLIETGLPLDWLSDDPKAVRAAGEAIYALAEQQGADIVQLNAPVLAAGRTSALPTVAVAHGCVSTWWEAAHAGVPLPDELAWHRGMMHEGLRAADRVVAPTASYAAILARHYRLSAMPDAVHNGRTPLAPRNVAEPARRVLTVGRLWDRVKRAELLDRVAARLSVPFAAAGAETGPHGERVVLRHLEPLGQIDARALGHELARQPVFVSAASFEPFGLAVLEAAQAGAALVLADTPGFRELWDGAATFVPGDDEAAYVAAITRLLDEPDVRARQGAAARARAQRYTPAATGSAMRALYADVTSTAGGRRAA